MALKLMYITNNPDVASVAESAGVDRIFVDMEYVGKDIRQKGMDTVQSHHTIQDIINVKEKIRTAELLVRCNPIHEETEQDMGTKKEIDLIVESGADLVMLPYFKTCEEVQKFLGYVDGRIKTVLLFETPEAVEIVDEILDIDGIDEVFIGLNDLSLGYGRQFMFELLADGTVEALTHKFRLKKIPFGFGGIAAVGAGMLPAERIIREHYRLFSQSVILSRSFCNTSLVTDLDEIKQIFSEGVKKIREVELESKQHMDYFRLNMIEVEKSIECIKMRNK